MENRKQGRGISHKKSSLEKNSKEKRPKRYWILCFTIISVFILLSLIFGYFVMKTHFSKDENLIAHPIVISNDIIENVRFEPKNPDINQTINLTITLDRTTLEHVIELRIELCTAYSLGGSNVSLKNGVNNYTVSLGKFSKPKQIWVVVIAVTNNSYAFNETTLNIGQVRNYFESSDTHYEPKDLFKSSIIKIYSNISFNSSSISTFATFTTQYMTAYICIDSGKIFLRSGTLVETKGFSDYDECSTTIVKFKNSGIFVLQRFICTGEIKYFSSSEEYMKNHFSSKEEFEQFMSPTVMILI